MNHAELYQELKRILTKEGLHRITVKLLDLYRSRRFHEILSLYERLRRIVPNQERLDHPARVFAALVKLYHPDTFNHHLHKMETGYAEKDVKLLSGLLDLMRIPFEIEERPGAVEESEEFESEPDWRYGEEDFDDYRTEGEEEEFAPDDDEDEIESGRSFLSVIRILEPGLVGVEITESLLGAFEGELDLSGYGLDDLYGLGSCVHLSSLDLSDNDLDSIDELSTLSELETVFLSGNHLTDLDPLAGLNRLVELDVSFNEIVEISALMRLENLRFVNLIGNFCHPDQIRFLQEKGVTVLF